MAIADRVESLGGRSGLVGSSQSLQQREGHELLVRRTLLGGCGQHVQAAAPVLCGDFRIAPDEIAGQQLRFGGRQHDEGAAWRALGEVQRSFALCVEPAQRCGFRPRAHAVGREPGAGGQRAGMVGLPEQVSASMAARMPDASRAALASSSARWCLSERGFRLAPLDAGPRRKTRSAGVVLAVRKLPAHRGVQRCQALPCRFQFTAVEIDAGQEVTGPDPARLGVLVSTRGLDQTVVKIVSPARS